MQGLGNPLERPGMSPSVPALTGTTGALVPIGYFLEERKSEFVLVWLKSCFLSMVVFFFFLVTFSSIKKKSESWRDLFKNEK